MSKYIFILASLISFASFLFLSKYEDRQSIRSLDLAVTVKVQEKIDNSKRLRTVQLIDTVLGGAEFFASPAFTVFVTLVMTALAFTSDSRSWMVRSVSNSGSRPHTDSRRLKEKSDADSGRRSRRGRNWKALIIPIALVAIVFVEVYGKSAVHHPGPPFGYIKHTTGLFPDTYVSAQFSYPSGHAARAVFMALLIYFSLFTFHFSRRKRLVMGVALGLYVFLVSVSKVYLGHHWASDIAGGVFLGATFGLSVLWFLLGAVPRSL